ncbi:MAG: glycosyltransferase, partial [Candidatus Hydrogenedentes bacterium]|nr:glycosyltransferase [Candidatus Hydrogenedentota bacterium]
MKRFRVAHVITRLCKGGAQENTVSTVRLANRDRFEADLISGPTYGSEGSIEGAVVEAGIEIHRVPHLVRSPNPRQDFLAYRELTRIFRERRYDIIHTHTSKAGYLGRLAAAHTGVPILVHTPHG